MSAHTLLSLITFYTMATDLQAWTVKRGTKAPHAAGKIHTDFEKGFIRAEVVHYADLIAVGTEHHAREKGLLRSEGKEYEVAAGDTFYVPFGPFHTTRNPNSVPLEFFWITIQKK